MKGPPLSTRETIYYLERKLAEFEANGTPRELAALKVAKFYNADADKVQVLLGLRELARV